MDKRVFLILLGIIILGGAVLGIKYMLNDQCEPPAITNEPLNPEVGQTVTFKVETASDEKITWEFGDGKTSSGSVVTHIFDSARPYSVKATIKEDCFTPLEVNVRIPRPIDSVAPDPDADKIAKDKAEQGRIERDKVEGDRLKAEKDKVERDRITREKAEKDKDERDRIAREKAEKDRIAKEKGERDKAERDRIARDKIERDRIAKEKADLDKAERNRIANDKAERDKGEKERIAKDKAESDKAERDRIEKERSEFDQKFMDIANSLHTKDIDEGNSMSDSWKKKVLDQACDYNLCKVAIETESGTDTISIKKFTDSMVAGDYKILEVKKTNWKNKKCIASVNIKAEDLKK